jgi:alanine racemase
MQVDLTHPTWIEINLSAVTNNCAHIIHDTHTALMAIVKGEAFDLPRIYIRA